MMQLPHPQLHLGKKNPIIPKPEFFRAFLGGGRIPDHKITTIFYGQQFTRWAPTSHKWGYIPYEWPKITGL